jgi:hypothetical protein
MLKVNPAFSQKWAIAGLVEEVSTILSQTIGKDGLPGRTRIEERSGYLGATRGSLEKVSIPNGRHRSS